MIDHTVVPLLFCVKSARMHDGLYAHLIITRTSSCGGHGIENQVCTPSLC